VRCPRSDGASGHILLGRTTRSPDLWCGAANCGAQPDAIGSGLLVSRNRPGQCATRGGFSLVRSVLESHGAARPERMVVFTKGGLWILRANRSDTGSVTLVKVRALLNHFPAWSQQKTWRCRSMVLSLSNVEWGRVGRSSRSPVHVCLMV
jgi:hypothetical protein